MPRSLSRVGCRVTGTMGHEKAQRFRRALVDSSLEERVPLALPAHGALEGQGHGALAALGVGALFLELNVLVALGGSLGGLVREGDALARRVDAHHADHQLLAELVGLRWILSRSDNDLRVRDETREPWLKLDEDSRCAAVIDHAFHYPADAVLL